MLGTSFPLFTDRVPIGRIVNRLSKDLNVVDLSMYLAYELTFSVVCRSMLDMVLTVLFTTYFTLVPMSLVVIACVYVTYYYLVSYREVNRLDYMSRSLICQRLIQYNQGLTVTRAH